MLIHSPFPDPRTAAADAPLAQGGDLSPELLLHAYSRGIFPWYSAGEPILWWSPNPRCVLLPQELRVSHSLRKQMRREGWSLSVNQTFTEVIAACANTPRRGQGGTWLTPQMQAAYCRLHELGYAHSIEVCWQGQLVGGLYGVAIGRAFFGESMFHHRTDASKIALVGLVNVLKQRGFSLIDCQQATAHLLAMGARTWDRSAFLDALTAAVRGDADSPTGKRAPDNPAADSSAPDHPAPDPADAEDSTGA